MRSFDRRTAAVAIVCWSLGIGGGDIARAGIVFTSQTRSVRADINQSPFTRLFSSTAVGHFEQTADVIGDSQFLGRSTQTMSSDLSSNLIFFTGQWSGTRPGDPPTQPFTST
jgi:hypothetical protein